MAKDYVELLRATAAELWPGSLIEVGHVCGQPSVIAVRVGGRKAFGIDYRELTMNTPAAIVDILLTRDMSMNMERFDTLWGPIWC